MITRSATKNFMRNAKKKKKSVSESLSKSQETTISKRLEFYCFFFSVSK